MPIAPEIAVRAASPLDAWAICAIYNAAIAERGSTFETRPHSPVDFEGRIGAERFPFLVAEVGGRILGWASISRYSAHRYYAEIGEASIYVDAEARGRGVGTALAEALADAAERRGFQKLLGKLFTDNVASIRLTEKCGFSLVGLHRRHGQLDGEWRDVLLVERLLRP